MHASLDVLHRCSQTLSDHADTMLTSLRSLELFAHDVLSQQWQGSACNEYKTLWVDWHKKCVAAVILMAENSQIVAQTAHVYSAEDTAESDTIDDSFSFLQF